MPRRIPRSDKLSDLEADNDLQHDFDKFPMTLTCHQCSLFSNARIGIVSATNASCYITNLFPFLATEPKRDR